MRKRNFYPRQVAKRLNRKNPHELSSAEMSAFRFFLLKGRKVGISVKVLQADISDLKDAPLDNASAIFGNSKQTIFIHRAQRSNK